VSDQDQPELFPPDEPATPGRKRKAAPKPVAPNEAADPLLNGGAVEAEPSALPHGHLPGAASSLHRLMDGNFLQYASYVICDRAVPHLDDGLKPVQRRILWALHDKDDGRFIKVANVVGHTMQYHPHGDTSIGDALVNLENKRYLIEGQGNFGNLYTGDRAAAPRYIECRLTELARQEIFHDALTPLIPSYDGRNKEPVVLPCKLPLVLMLGAEGIAVGLSTRILPHNFGELLEAQIAILRKKPFTVLPDFPQGGLLDAREYGGGNGRVRVRARIREKDKHPGVLVITEIPFGTTTESLIASIEEAARTGKVPVRTINDFTAAHAEIELTLSPGANPEQAVQALYAFTACEQSLSSRIIVIRDNRPAEMDVPSVLKANTERLVYLLDAELKHRKNELTEEIHAKTLVQLFVENRIYKKIESCTSYPEVQKAVLDGLAPFRPQLRRDITTDDVEMLLGVRIRRISLFDIQKNRKEIDGLVLELAQVEKNIGTLVPYAIRYLQNLLKVYGPQYPRRTESCAFGEVEVRALTARELAVKIDREKGYLGTEVEGEPLLECSSLDKLVAVWADGRYKVFPPPDKLFTDTNLLYAATFDRDRVMTAVFRWEQITFLKRFTFGGAIQNKDYLCAPEGAEVLFFTDAEVPELYMRYKPAKNQKIHQQIFKPGDVPVKGVQARGNQMTMKVVDKIAAGPGKPRWWRDEDGDGPKGVLFNV
jgi:topoisomerase-4 subunit A